MGVEKYIKIFSTSLPAFLLFFVACHGMEVVFLPKVHMLEAWSSI
jgi:hypothetical protein